MFSLWLRLRGFMWRNSIPIAGGVCSFISNSVTCHLSNNNDRMTERVRVRGWSSVGSVLVGSLGLEARTSYSTIVHSRKVHGT